MEPVCLVSPLSKTLRRGCRACGSRRRMRFRPHCASWRRPRGFRLSALRKKRPVSHFLRKVWTFVPERIVLRRLPELPVPLVPGTLCEHLNCSTAHTSVLPTSVQAVSEPVCNSVPPMVSANLPSPSHWGEFRREIPLSAHEMSL